MTLRLPVPADFDVPSLLDRQVQVMFLLAEEVLADVSLDECLWRPNERSWTVHLRDGRWYGELDEEPPDVPIPSLGWTMWHPVWWLQTLLAATLDLPTPAVQEVEWPGPSATLPALREMWRQWTDILSALPQAELGSGRLTRFPYTDDRPFAYVASWASMELTKNLSEMCMLRRLQKDVAR